MKAEILEKIAIQLIEIIKFQEDSSFVCTDDIAVEEPLEIRVSYCSKEEKISKIFRLRCVRQAMTKNWR